MTQFAQVMAEVGDFGRFQVRVTILMGIPNFLSAFFVFSQVFMVLDETHHCSVSWVKNHTFNLSAAEQLAVSIPNDTAGRPESCLMFRPPPDGASLEDILSHRFNETQACDSGWDYPENRPQSLKNEVGWAACCLCAHLCGLSVPLSDLVPLILTALSLVFTPVFSFASRAGPLPCWASQARRAAWCLALNSECHCDVFCVLCGLSGCWPSGVLLSVFAQLAASIRSPLPCSSLRRFHELCPMPSLPSSLLSHSLPYCLPRVPYCFSASA